MPGLLVFPPLRILASTMGLVGPAAGVKPPPIDRICRSWARTPVTRCSSRCRNAKAAALIPLYDLGESENCWSEVLAAYSPGILYGPRFRRSKSAKRDRADRS